MSGMGNHRPGASGPSQRLPGRGSFPPLDEHLVERLSLTNSPPGTRRRRPRLFGVLALCLLAALILWFLVPSPIDSVAYEAPRSLELNGPLAPNEALRSARLVGEDRLVGAEDVAIDAAGRLYTGTEDGRIVRVTLTPDGP